jgi:RNA polymerase sigma-70 factor, ECF subfamily
MLGLPRHPCCRLGGCGGEDQHGGVNVVTALAVAARAGDRRALESLLRAVQADVWRYCSVMVGPDDADDVTQNALLRVMRALPGYREEAPALVWVLSVTRRTALDWLRSAYRRRAMLDRLRLHTVGEVHLDGSWAEVVELLSSLDVDRREAFVLTQVLGWPYADAAAVSGCPVGTIRSRVARARLDLLGQLESCVAVDGREPS